MHRILLIDDDPLVRTALSRLLQHAGHLVHAAEGGEAGLGLFRAQGADLVITDMLMPDGNGLDVILGIRHSPQPVPVIVMSGGELSDTLDLLGDAKLLGAIDFLPKPCTGDELLAAVQQALERKPGDAPLG